MSKPEPDTKNDTPIAAQPTPNPTIDPAPSDNGKAKNITAAALVDEDKDVFPNAPAPSSMDTPPGMEVEPPKKSKRGGARAGAGRPPKNVDMNGPSSGPVFDVKPSEPVKPPVDYVALSSMMFGMTTNILAQTLGPEWLPRPGTPEQPRPGQPPIPAMPGEDQMIIPVLAKYLEAQQMPDLPPGVMLTLVVAAYAAPRFRAPATKEKIKGVWFCLRSKFGRKNRGPVAVYADKGRQDSKAKSEIKVEEEL